MKRLLLAIVLCGCSDYSAEISGPGESSFQPAREAVRDSVELPARLVKPPFCPCLPNIDCNCWNYQQ
jgi:hypothetical protein